MDRRRLILSGATLAATRAAAQGGGGAEAWPQARPVTVLVPFVAGGPSDIVARAIAARAPGTAR